MAAERKPFIIPCKKCGNPISFVKTPQGKNLPIDPEPVDPGDLNPETDALVTRDGRVLKKQRIFEVDDGFIPHWATCPFAEDFREKPPRKEAVK